MYASTRPSNNQVKRNSDPFAALARDFLGFDPFAIQAKSTHSPRFDLLESEDAYILRADLPGLLEENLEITVHEDFLTISGNRHDDEVKEGEKFLVRERRAGTFSRQLKLAKDADSAQIEAKLNAGVLVVTIAKRPEAKARKIQLG